MTIISSLLFVAVLSTYAPAQIFTGSVFNLQKGVSSLFGIEFNPGGKDASPDSLIFSSQYFQGFETDGVWAPTSTVTRVASGTNGVTSKTGSFHGEVGTQNTQWGGYNSTFPTLGYTTAVSIYLNVGGGFANNTRFDWDSSINDSTGNFRRDFIFNAGYFNDSDVTGTGPRFVVSASFNSQPGSAFAKNPGNSPIAITSSGWYTFRHRFYNNGSGALAVEMTITNSSNAVVGSWIRSNPGDTIATTGGNRYGWFDYNEFTFLAIDDSERANIVPPPTVYVDDNWTGTTLGADPDGAGPATSYGYDAFDNINGAADIVATGGTINVYSGTYPLTSTVNLDKAGVTVVGLGTKPVVQVALAAGSAFFVTADGVTLDNLEIQKTDLPGEHNLIRVQANNFTAQNNLIYGPNPGMTWNAAGIVSRGFVISANSNITIQNNVIRNLRQPAYMSGNPGTGGTISGNNVSGTKGWVVEGGAFSFTGNTWGEPQNQDCDIALLASVNPANYTPLLGLSNANDNGFICAQYAGGENGRATAYVDDNAAPGGNGSDNANYQSITSAIAGTLNGGTVEVAAGGYNEDVTVSKSVTVNGAGVDNTTVTGPIGGGGSTFAIQASNVEIRNLKITRAGNNTTDWNNAGLNTAGVSVQGLSITGLNLHDTLITGNRSAIDINNSNGHNIHNNVITDNHTGVIFRNQTDNITFVQNAVTNNRTVGVLFLDASGGTNVPVQSALNGNFSNNSISGNWYGQIVDRQSGGSLPAPGTTNLKNFGGNWYGTSSPAITVLNSAEPGYASLIPVAYGGTAVPPAPQPEIAGAGSDNFDYSPYLNGGADTDGFAYGFQGSFSALNVNATSPQTNGSLSNIQEGINMVTASGTLNIANGTYNGNVDVNKVLTLKGTPTINGTLTASVAGARISPGFSPGIINSGTLTLSAGTFVDIELNGTTAGTGYDQINVTGAVNLGGATLNVTNGFVPSVGNTFTIINNDGGDAVNGIFQDLPEGTVFFVGANSYKISYVGGTGNDVVLTSVSLCNTVSIPSGITTPTGAPVTVPVNVDDVSGKGLLSFDVRVNYNPAVINSPVVNLTPLTAGRSLTVNTATPGLIIISVFGTDPLAGSGSLVDITFNAVGSIGSTSAVSFNSFLFNEGTPCLSTSNGSVNIISGTVSGVVTYAHNSASVPGTNLNGVGSVNVSAITDLTGAYTLSGFGAGAYTVTPSKTGDINAVTITSNDSAAIAQYVANLITLNPTQLAAADVSGSNTVTSFDAALIARYVVLLPNSGNTGTWRFTPTNRAYASLASNFAAENYSALLMGDVTGNWTTTITMFAPFVEEVREEDKVRVILPNVSAKEDSLVTVPLEISPTTGKGIVSYQFDLVYNPKSIEPQEVLVDKVDTLSRGMTVTYNSIDSDRIRVAVFGVMPLEGKGTLLNLKFNVVGGDKSSSPLKLEKFVFNENTQLAAPTDGEIQITAASEDAISVEGQLTTSTGKAVANAKVILTDTKGGVRAVQSDESGYFKFKNVTKSETYTISVSAKRYAFAPQTVSASDGIVKINLIAEP